jgi:hypothetical protein
MRQGSSKAYLVCSFHSSHGNVGQFKERTIPVHDIDPEGTLRGIQEKMGFLRNFLVGFEKKSAGERIIRRTKEFSHRIQKEVGTVPLLVRSQFQMDAPLQIGTDDFDEERQEAIERSNRDLAQRQNEAALEMVRLQDILNCILREFEPFYLNAKDTIQDLLTDSKKF